MPRALSGLACALAAAAPLAFSAPVWAQDVAADAGPDAIQPKNPTATTAGETGGDTAVDEVAEQARRVNLDRARESYRNFLDLAPLDDPRRALALRRLADLELERAEEALANGDPPDATAQGYAAAIDLYTQFRTRYPDDADNDVVLYQLARAHGQRGDSDAALQVLAELASRFPESAYVAESHFRRGESLFSQGQFAPAADAYAAVLALPEHSTFVEQALYKHGWSMFRLSQYEPGLASFYILAQRMLAPDGAFSESSFEQLNRAETELLEDALRASSVSFSYLEGVQSLSGFLRERESLGFEHLYFQRLGDLYLSQQRFSDAAQTYEAFAAQYPDRDRAPSLQLAVIETYRTAGFADKVLAAKEQFSDQYALTGPFWISRDRTQFPEVVDAIKLHLGELTQHYHAAAQTTGSAHNYAQATRWYRLWLNSFPQDPGAPATRFLLAELLFEQSLFDEATAEYERSAYEYGPHEKAAEAGYAALLSYDRHAASLQGQALADWQRFKIDSSLRFAETFSTHEQASAVLTDAAEQLFNLKEYEGALQAATRLVQWQPPAATGLQRTAWAVIGHTHFDREHFSQAEQAYTRLSSVTPTADPQFAQVQERLAASVYKQGEVKRDAGDLTGAVDAFLRVATAAPSAAIVPTAQYDAALALMQVEDWSRAGTVLREFRAQHTNHPLQAEVTRNLAVAYLASEQPQQAGEELARMAQAPTTELPARREAAWQAAQQFELAKNTQHAAATYGYLLAQLSPPLDEAVDAREAIARIHDNAGNQSAYHEALRGLVQMDQRAGAGRSERSRSAAADAALVLADAQLPQFQAIRLHAPLAQSLQLKKTAMQTLLDAYAQASSYQIAEVSTASSYRIAEIYRELGSALMTSQRPPGLSELELEQYELLLEEQAFPFEEKAIEVHEANAQRSSDGLFNQWVKASFARLAELLPARYAKVEKGETLVTYME